MGKLILQMQTSLDMFVSAHNSDFEWLVWPWDPANWPWDKKLREYHEATTKADIIILSSNMANEGFIDHWAAIAKQKDSPQSTFAQNITNSPKIIFSRDSFLSRWPNTTTSDKPLATKITALKQQHQTILSFGGTNFARALVAQKLVDEFHFVVNPSIVLEGDSIFEKPTLLSLIDTVPYESGIVVARYKPGE